MACSGGVYSKSNALATPLQVPFLYVYLVLLSSFCYLIVFCNHCQLIQQCKVALFSAILRSLELPRHVSYKVMNNMSTRYVGLACVVICLSTQPP